METPLLDKLYAEGQGPHKDGEPPMMLDWKGMKWNLDAHGNLLVKQCDSGNWYALYPEQAEVYIKARLAGAKEVAIGQYTYVC